MTPRKQTKSQRKEKQKRKGRKATMRNQLKPKDRRKVKPDMDKHIFNLSRRGRDLFEYRALSDYHFKHFRTM